MQSWFINYVGPTDCRRTFQVDASTKADAIGLGDSLAGTWLRQQGIEPGDLRGTAGECASPRLDGCWPVPPAWVGIFGRRDAARTFTRVCTAPTVSAVLDFKGDVPPPWKDNEDLPLRLDLRSHSPSGFEWGYLGSGPAQLAVAACAFALGDERAERVYQDIKDRLFASIQTTEWVVTVGRLRELADTIERQREADSREKGDA